ncbi:RibD family protein [Methanobacterium formicicum]|uniref:Bifunctional deaminase-reductase domain-containing protein n=1 Tax=Methanobacterium formicicum TaxID=2162 RepID=A0A090I5V4_METFO|nr:RibD family protein [Methanobacterium formicicum]MDH2660248.1 RibD family protein [Methanobacterium formicicum]CEA13455.1 bifunctional deaminase-reductase domain-containing protein [Methanobacterium formicicum]
MIPLVILYNAVSLDGRITGFDADVELYYELASKWNVDAVLMGSNTVLTGFGVKTGQTVPESEDAFQPRVKDPDDKRPLLVVPDSRGQIRVWSEILKMPYINDVLVLCSRSTPREYLDFLDERYIDYLVVGYQQVDLENALEELNTKFGVKRVRVDSGGVLNGILLRQGLADEIHLLIHPELVGGTTPNSIFQTHDTDEDGEPIKLYLDGMEKIKDDIIYLRYRVLNGMLK